jgi:group I intron endonuclease
MLIYCLTSPSGKKYIGQTIRKFKERLLEHSTNKRGDCRAINNAIKKYGIENFTKEILIDFGNLDNQILLDSYEIYYINLFGTFNNKEKGYNLSSGGNGGRPSDETRKKMSYSHSGERNIMYGKKHTEETKKKIAKSNAGKTSSRKGVVLSEETKRKLSESRKGIIPWNKGIPRTDEEKKKISDANKGRKHTEQSRINMGNSRKGKPRKNHSDETKKKMSEKRKGTVPINRKPVIINGGRIQFYSTSVKGNR